MKKVLFTGYYGFNNFGDDLFSLASTHSFEANCHGYDAVVLSPPVKGVKGKFLVPGWLAKSYKGQGAIGKVLRLIFMIYGCIVCEDLVLAGGSVISSDSSFRMRSIQLWMSKLGFCRISAIGVSVGPFKSSRDREAAKEFIDSLVYLSVRDEASVSEVKRLDVATDVHLYNDLAGCVPLPECQPHERNAVLGVSVCRYESLNGLDTSVENARNTAIFKGVCLFALETDIEVKVFILNEDQVKGDVDLSERLLSYLLKQGVRAKIIRYLSPKESLKEISNCKIFLSVRLHGAIAAYLLNLPFLLVEYHKKCKDFLDHIEFDNSSRLHAYANDPNEILDKLKKISHSRPYNLEPLEYVARAEKTFKCSPWATNK
jgi:polysaccharide pyruvyl transferase WcaK-like protein